jgi:hypothetical protein
MARSQSSICTDNDAMVDLSTIIVFGLRFADMRTLIVTPAALMAIRQAERAKNCRYEFDQDQNSRLIFRHHSPRSKGAIDANGDHHSHDHRGCFRPFCRHLVVGRHAHARAGQISSGCRKAGLKCPLRRDRQFAIARYAGLQ